MKKIDMVAIGTIAMVACLLLCTPALANYNFDGFPVVTRDSGTVNGGVFIDSEPWAATTTLTGNFNVPTGNIAWARLYTGIWGGRPEYEGWVSVTFNGVDDSNGLGPIHLQGANDANPNVWCSGNGKYWMYYEVTDLVNAGAVNTATTTKINETAGAFDGRVYGIVLVVVYEGGANPKDIRYWINDGSDGLNYDTPHNDGTTDFAGLVAGSVTNAELTMVHLTAYEPGCANCLQFNDNVLDTSMVDSNTFELNSWDVASHVEPSGNDALYSRGDDGYVNVCNAILTLELEELPDLVVEKSVEVGDDNFIVSYTVTNIGDGPAGVSTTCKYVDGVLQETQPCPALAPDESHSGAFDPEECPCGETLNVTVCADNDNVVDESEETNNCEVNFVDCPPCKPDLVVGKVVEIGPDGKFIVSYTVTNIGGGDAGPSTTCKYVDGELQESQICPALVPDASHSGAFDPEECPCGETLNVTVCADNEDVVNESNEDNNCEVNFVDCPPCKPDLVVGKVVEIGPDGKFIVSYTVTNIGGGDAGPSTTCKYVDGELQESQICPALVPDASYSGAFDPEECPCGETLNVTVCADNEDVVNESNEDNNCEVNFVDCPPCKPDLVVGKVVEIGPDGKFIVSYTVTNIGGGDAGPSTTCKYVDGELQESQICPALVPDASHSGVFDPEECPCGETLNVTVCADNEDVVNESNEDNNCEVNFVDCPPCKPDLVVGKVVEIGPDGKFIVSYTVTNIGGALAGESTTCKYVDGELQETQPCPALIPDASYSGVFDPEECPCGETLNVTVCADNEDVVNESNEDNNCEVNFVDCPPCKPDLTVTEITVNYDASGLGGRAVGPVPGPDVHTECNNLSAVIGECNGVDVGAPFDVTFEVDGTTLCTVNVPSLTGGSTKTVYCNCSWYPYAGDAFAINVTADSNHEIPESDETNNTKWNNGTVVSNGYKGDGWQGPDMNLINEQCHDQDTINLTYSVGDSEYVSGSTHWTEYTSSWTTGDLPVPDGATIEKAILYVYYTWDKNDVMPDNVSLAFNGNNIALARHYSDSKGFGSYDFPAGMLIYDVRSHFTATGPNNAILTKAVASDEVSMRGMLLMAIYNHPDEPERIIYIDEGYDMLYAKDSYAVTSEEATTYAPFTRCEPVPIEELDKATLIAVAPSASDGDDMNRLSFNAGLWNGIWDHYEANTQLGIAVADVFAYLEQTDNRANFQSHIPAGGDKGDFMDASNAFLILEKKVVAKPDLNVSKITVNYDASGLGGRAVGPVPGPDVHTECNNLSAVIGECNGVDVGAPFDVTFEVDGTTLCTVNVPSLTGGSTKTVYCNCSWYPYAGDAFAINVTADSNHEIPESDETNNTKWNNGTVVSNGYKGDGWQGPDMNLINEQCHDQDTINLTYSVGDSEYVSGSTHWTEYTSSWTTGDLPVPDGATIEKAILYVYYTWDKNDVMPDNVSLAFNGNNIALARHYSDSKGFGSYDFPAGMLIYDVRSHFTATGPNNAILTKAVASDEVSMRGMLLMAIYNHPDEPERIIYIDEGYDMLYAKDSYAVTSEEATTYAPFTRCEPVPIEELDKATLIAVAPSASDGDDMNRLSFNAGLWNGIWDHYEANTQLGIAVADVFAYLEQTDNRANFQSHIPAGGDKGDFMDASNAFLILEKKVVAKPDLNVSKITVNYDASGLGGRAVGPVPGPDVHTECNNLSAVIGECNGVDVGAPFDVTFEVDGTTLCTVNVPSLTGGSTKTVYCNCSWYPYAGDAFAINVTADSNHEIPESDETNNTKWNNGTVVSNGYKGDGWQGPDMNLINEQCHDQDTINLTYSVGDSEYVSGSTHWTEYTSSWTTGDLPVPDGATIEKAILYVYYTWDKNDVMPDNVSLAFNGNNIALARHYSDSKGFGSYDFPAGMLIYDVRSHFTATGPNNAILTKAVASDEVSMRGMLLMAIYNHPDEPERIIYIDEGYDMLYAKDSYAVTSEEATTYAPFTRCEPVPIEELDKATLIAVAPSASDGDDMNRLSFNAGLWNGIWDHYEANTQLGIAVADVFAYLEQTDNRANFQSHIPAGGDKGDFMDASNAFLILEKKVVAKPDLNVSKITVNYDASGLGGRAVGPVPGPDVHTECNNLSAVIGECNGVDVGAPFDVTFEVDGTTLCTVNVPSLTGGSTKTVYCNCSWYPYAGDAFAINVTADSNHEIPESDETNNTKWNNGTVVSNGYKGDGWQGPDMNLINEQCHDQDTINLTYSVGDSEYVSGSTHWTEYTSSWTTGDLPVPDGATIEKAILYVYYTWDKNDVMPDNVSLAFNGNNIALARHYSDSKGFGSYDFPAGMLIYDVRSHFTATGPNNAILTKAVASDEVSMRGMLLMAIYNHPDEPERIIYIDEGYDMLYAKDSYAVTSEEATTYAPFTRCEPVPIEELDKATLIAVAPSASDGDDMNRLSFNAGLWNGIWDHYEANTQLGIAVADVFAYLEQTDNRANFQSHIPAGGDKGDFMDASNAFLILEKKVVAKPDLNVSKITVNYDASGLGGRAVGPVPGPDVHTECNNLSAVIGECNGVDVGAPFDVTFEVDGTTLCTVNVPSLTGGSTKTVYCNCSWYPYAGDAFAINVTADSNHEIPESDETNNTKWNNGTVVSNGYKGDGWQGPDMNLINEQCHDQDTINLTYSVGDSEYVSGSTHWTEYTSSWTTGDLPVPDGATIEKAILYVYYTWDKNDVMPDNVSLAFNGNNIALARHYSDSKGFGSYDFPAGMLIYDVRSHFTATGPNNAILTKAVASDEVSMRGMLLMAIYNHPDEPERIIYIDEGYDMLYAKDSYAVTSEEATTYAPFTRCEPVPIEELDKATLIAVAPSASDGDDMNRLSFNAGLWNGIWDHYEANTQLGIAVADVFAYLEQTDNRANFQSHIPAGGDKGDFMDASNAFLILEKRPKPDLTVTEITVNYDASSLGGRAIGPEPGPDVHTECNNLSAVIEEENGVDVLASFDVTFEVDGTTLCTVRVPGLTGGANKTVYCDCSWYPYAGDVFAIKVTADSNHEIPESNETNNTKWNNGTVVSNGYKGDGWQGPDKNLENVQCHDQDTINLIYSVGDSEYVSGSTQWTEYTSSWTTTDLPVPDSAEIEKAMLYVYYTWDKDTVMPDDVTMAFNGNNIALARHYSDSKGFGGYDFPSGMLVYDVRSHFTATGPNNAILRKAVAADEVSMRGMLLMVIYKHPDEPERMICIDEGYDMLYAKNSYAVTSEEATTYAPFTCCEPVPVAELDKATLIAVAPSAKDGDDMNRLSFNAGLWNGIWDHYEANTQLGIAEANVLAYLKETDNRANFQSHIPAGGDKGDFMDASNAFLILEKKGEAPCPAEYAVYQAKVSDPEGRLNELRALRDQKLEDGYVDRYYEHSPMLTLVLSRADPDLVKDGAQLVSKYSIPVGLHVQGMDVNERITKQDVEEALSFTDRLKREVMKNRDAIGVESTEAILVFLDEFEGQVKASEGKTFSAALKSSIYYEGGQSRADQEIEEK